MSHEHPSHPGKPRRQSMHRNLDLYGFFFSLNSAANSLPTDPLQQLRTLCKLDKVDYQLLAKNARFSTF